MALVDHDPDRENNEAATLLVRRADFESVEQVRGVLGSSPVSLEELVRLTRGGGVLVLGDVALPPGAAPVAAVVLELGRAERRARLVALRVVDRLRGRGLGRRLFGGATMLLRSEGIERVDASAAVDTAAAAFLVAVGFVPALAEDQPTLVYWL